MDVISNFSNKLSPILTDYAIQPSTSADLASMFLSAIYETFWFYFNHPITSFQIIYLDKLIILLISESNSLKNSKGGVLIKNY
jgi:hypothetical protein